MVAGCRMPFHAEPTSGGGDIGDGLRAAPSRTPSRRIAAGGGVAQAPAPDTDRPRAAASCHARGTPVHVTCAPAPPWSPRPAAILGSGPKSAPLTGCPRGFSQVAGNGHPSGAHFSGCQGVRALSRGDPGPWPRRAKGGSGARAGSASCDYEAHWGAFPHNILSAKTSSETPGMMASWPPFQA